MPKQHRAIMGMAIVSLLLFFQACGASQEQVVPPSSGNVTQPYAGNPKLDSVLNQLIEANKRGEAEKVAQQGNIELINGGVVVIIECFPGQVKIAANAATNAGAHQVETMISNNWVRAIVPIDKLEALANEKSIRFIAVPARPVPTG